MSRSHVTTAGSSDSAFLDTRYHGEPNPRTVHKRGLALAPPTAAAPPLTDARHH